MRPWPRLHAEQTGQVLLPAVFLIVLLSLFALGLVNLIYLAALKLKAQNVADQLVLSVAARQARVLNALTEKNRAIEFTGLMFGSKRRVPYLPEERFAWNQAVRQSESARSIIRGFNAVINGLVERVCFENGLAPAETKVGLWPRPFLDDGTAGSNHVTKRVENFRLVGISEPQSLMTGFSPEQPWFVQTRVEWRVKDALIGAARLGFRLPDVTVHARAEIYDRNQQRGSWVDSVWVPAECNARWDVRLARAHTDVDQRLRADLQGR